MIVVGCPVRDRAWAMARWFTHLHRAMLVAGIAKNDALLLFIGDQHGDDSFTEIDRACLEHGYSRHVIDQPGTAEPYRRVWGWERYLEMAELRNELLQKVRAYGPDWYWSLDSDIFVSPVALASAIQALETYDAVGSRCYMTTKGVWCPSYGILSPKGGLVRPDAEGLMPVDVIMAAKLMAPPAYAVDYAAHRQGEDIGWSIAARHAGCTLGWDGRTVSKHVMDRLDIDAVDPRCGF